MLLMVVWISLFTSVIIALDFSGQNLRGRSFKGRQELAGANFSNALIEGADFTGANLRDANFCSVQAGLQDYRFRIFMDCIFASLCSLFSAYLEIVVFSSGYQTVLYMCLIAQAIYLGTFWRFGINRAFTFAMAFAFAGLFFLPIVSINVAIIASFVAAVLVAETAFTTTFIGVCVASSKAFSKVAVTIVASSAIVAFLVGISVLSGSRIAFAAVVLPLCGVIIGWNAMQGDKNII